MIMPSKAKKEVMNKAILEKFISLYNLGGNVNSVMLRVKNNQLTTEMTSPDRNLIGSVVLNSFEFSDADLGISDTEKLTKMLGVLDRNLTVTLNKVEDKNVSIKFNDQNVDVIYMLADETVIPEAARPKSLPEFEVKITIDQNFIDTFIKSYSALQEVESFTILSQNGELKLIIGYSENNTNRITLSLNTTEPVSDMDPISFPSELFKEVLSANKGSEGHFEISSHGLAHIHFTNEMYTSNYYLLERNDD